MQEDLKKDQMLDKDSIVTYIESSILDTQSTIRAIDTKCGILFAILAAPVFSSERILIILINMHNSGGIRSIISATIAIFWLLTLYILFMTIAAISNPADKVRNEKCHGTFFCGDLFKFGLLDVLCNLRNSSSISVSDLSKKISSNEHNIIDELIFEKMKLTYIRSMKLHRFKYCIYLSAIIMFSIVVCYAFYAAKPVGA